SGGGAYEYNGIVMFGGYNWVEPGSLNDIWVFCDHPDWNPYETDNSGCSHNDRRWIQFSYSQGYNCGWSPFDGKRHGASVTELHGAVRPLTDHGKDDEFLVWGGVRVNAGITTYLRAGLHMFWVGGLFGAAKYFGCVN